MSSFQTSNFNFKLINPCEKTIKECKAYIREYFVPLRDGNHAVLEDGKYVLKDEATIKEVFLRSQNGKVLKQRQHSGAVLVCMSTCGQSINESTDL